MEERRGFGQRRGGFRRREGGFAPKPVEIGKVYEVDVSETSRRGEGIARIQGLVIFIPSTKTGDHVKIKIKRVSRRFAEGEVVGKGEAEAETEEEEEEE
jgi:predicted RNA-binding protein with TRAM domain